MKYERKKNDLKTNQMGELFRVKIPKKAFSCRLSHEVLELIKIASNTYGVSFSDVLEGCVKNTLKQRIAG